MDWRDAKSNLFLVDAVITSYRSAGMRSIIRSARSSSVAVAVLFHWLPLMIFLAIIGAGCEKRAKDTIAQQHSAPQSAQEIPELALAKKEIELLKKENELLKAELATLRQQTNVASPKTTDTSGPTLKGNVYFRSKAGRQYTLSGQTVYLCDAEIHKKIITDYINSHLARDSVTEAFKNLDQFSSPIRLDLYADYVAKLTKMASESKISTKTDKDGAYAFAKLPPGTNYVFTTMVVEGAVGFWSERVATNSEGVTTLDLDQSNAVKVWEKVHEPLK